MFSNVLRREKLLTFWCFRIPNLFSFSFYQSWFFKFCFDNFIIFQASFAIQVFRFSINFRFSECGVTNQYGRFQNKSGTQPVCRGRHPPAQLSSPNSCFESTLFCSSTSRFVCAPGYLWDPLLPCYVQRRVHTDQKLRVHLALQKNRLPLPSPPLVMTAPKVDLSLTDFPKKSTTPEIYRAHFSEIVNSQPNVTICYSDGSKSGNRVGYAFQ